MMLLLLVARHGDLAVSTRKMREEPVNFEKKKCKHHICHPKIYLHNKFYTNQTMEKCSNPEGKGWQEEGGEIQGKGGISK